MDPEVQGVDMDKLDPGPEVSRNSSSILHYNKKTLFAASSVQLIRGH